MRTETEDSSGIEFMLLVWKDGKNNGKDNKYDRNRSDRIHNV